MSSMWNNRPALLNLYLLRACLPAWMEPYLYREERGEERSGSYYRYIGSLLDVDNVWTWSVLVDNGWVYGNNGMVPVAR